ncbi:MAG: glycosyltransferase family 4 protein, partial [Chloroflexi bacterium]|nr:glycosyltransferase family 4 protein [Chloroflexota bacterium]
VGGTELYTQRLAAGLLARGHSVRVLTWAEPDALSPEASVSIRTEPGDGAASRPEVLRLAFDLAATGNPVRDEYDNPRVADCVRGLWRQRRPDVVHVTHCGYLSSAPLAVAADLGIPSAVTLTDLWALCPAGMLLRHDSALCAGPDDLGACARCLAHMGPRGARLARYTDLTPRCALRAAARLAECTPLRRVPPAAWLRALRARPAVVRERMLSAHALLSPSQHQIALFERNGYPRERLRWAPHGIPDPQTMRHAPRRPEPGAPLRVGYIGPLAPHKGAHLPLDAWRRLGAGGGATLSYHGPQPQPDRPDAYGTALLRRIAATPGASHHGPFANSSVANVLDTLDLLIVPSLCYENTPTIVYEALAHGTPVLGSNQGGVRELVTLYQGGWLFARNDAEALAAQLRALLQQPALVSAAAARILPVPAMAGHVAGVAALYAEVVHGR